MGSEFSCPWANANKFLNLFEGDKQLNIFDPTGRLNRKVKIISANTTIEKGTLRQGFYLYDVFSDGKKLAGVNLLFSNFYTISTMSRSSLILPFFRILFTKPSVILKSLFHGVNDFLMKEKVIKGHPMPQGIPCIDILDLLPDFNVEISNYSFLNGTSTTIDIALLKALAALFKDCSYLEIGTWRGESIANVADVVKECISISLSDKEMYALGFNERFTNIQRFFSKEKKNIEYIYHNSLTFDFSKLNKKFDLIFVDGDHSYEAVKKDTENVFNLLKDENSIIVWHDYAAAFEMPAWHVAAAILDGTPADKRKNLYCVSNTLCAIYTTKKIKSSPLDYPTYPNKKFDVAIKAIPIRF